MVRAARLAVLCAAGISAVLPASAHAFGTAPVPISAGPSGEGANGPSGGGTISGDNRKSRLAAFHSEASNLVAADGNGVADVFVYNRPRGTRGTVGMGSGPARPAGSLRRVSLTNSGGEANGPSLNPALDGRLAAGDRSTTPRCVAFQSEASNLAPGDANRTSDIFVRNLSTNRTTLVSRGIGPAATNPAIDGACRNVGFEAGGRVYLARIGGPVRSLGSGSQIDLALDGEGIVWRAGSRIRFRRAGRTSTVAPGQNPTVSDRERIGSRTVWAVSFETRSKLIGRDGNPGFDVYTRTFGPRGGSTGTDLISATRRGGSSLGGESQNGGLTAYAARRGIIVFVNHRESGSTLYYRNNNSGNIDDLAVAGRGEQPNRTAPRGFGGRGAARTAPLASGAQIPPDPAIFDVYTSSRANFVAFSSKSEGFPFDRNGPVQDVFFKHLIDGDRL